jgi:hypothetical protein
MDVLVYTDNFPFQINTRARPVSVVSCVRNKHMLHSITSIIQIITDIDMSVSVFYPVCLCH